jgi:hypothetical protein
MEKTVFVSTLLGTSKSDLTVYTKGIKLRTGITRYCIKKGKVN